LFPRQLPRLTEIQKGHPDSLWYGTLYKELLSASSLATVRRGDNIQDKQLPIRRNLLLQIIRELLFDASPVKYEHRLMLVLLYQSVGRSNELHATNLELQYFCSTLGAMWLTWNQGKVSLLWLIVLLSCSWCSRIPHSTFLSDRTLESPLLLPRLRPLGVVLLPRIGESHFGFWRSFAEGVHSGQ
jgi:hypothetical protein